MSRKVKIEGLVGMRNAASVVGPETVSAVGRKTASATCTLASGGKPAATRPPSTFQLKSSGDRPDAQMHVSAIRPSPCRRARTPSEEAEYREFREWMSKYEPVERAILEERDRRAESKRRRELERRKAFGDLCEMTEGLAAFARRNNMTLSEATKQLRRVRLPHPALALPYMLLTDAWSAACALRRTLTARIDRAKHAVKRPAYYAQERARRQALAAERRKVRMRHTINPCPTRMAILDAWTKVKESPENLLRFGSLMEDLECYVDNSLRRTDDGMIVGRRPGIKGWLQLEIPALYVKYKTVMAYKAAAKRMRQVLDIRDPLPLSAALPQEGTSQDYGTDEIQSRRGAERQKAGAQKVGASRAVMDEADELEVLRAGAVCAEVMTGVGVGARRTAALMRRLAELTDPDRVEDANMLAAWREGYRRKITARTKSMWERRLKWTG